MGEMAEQDSTIIKEEIEQPKANSLVYEIGYLLLSCGMIAYAFYPKDFKLEFSIYVIWAVIVIRCKNTFFNRQILGSKPMVFFGKISYSVYMWHMGIIMLIDKQRPYLAQIVTLIGVAVYQLENILRVSNNPLVIPSIACFGFVLLTIAITVCLF